MFNMFHYRVAGQDFTFMAPIPELEPFAIGGIDTETASEIRVPAAESRVCQITGWVAGAQRLVENWLAPPGMLLRVAGGSDFYISPDGRSIVPVNAPGPLLNQVDREILVGPALVLGLSLCDVWSLHASAVLFGQQMIVFVGESGQGKSTLAARLCHSAASRWRLVADDILPVTLDMAGALAWPHFPQLKLPAGAQPGPFLPENLPLARICVLESASLEQKPALQRLPPTQAVRVLLGHTAGTRMFTPALLAAHLAFCTQLAWQAPVYSLPYPHRWDSPEEIRKLLESAD